MHAVACILSYDGHAGLSSPPESVGSKQSRTEMYDTGGWEEKPNSFLNSLFWSLSLKENKHPSHGNRNRQHDYNMAPTEAPPMPRQQNNKQRKPKSANNGDSGKKKEKTFVNHTNVINQPEAASTAKQSKNKSANGSGLGNKKENMPSDQVYVNKQPNTAPREAAAASTRKNQSSKKTKTRSGNNSDSGKKKDRYVPKIDIHKRQREDKAEQKENA